MGNIRDGLKDGFEDRLACRAFVHGDSSEDAIQSAEIDGTMQRDCNSLVAWHFRRQEQVAPFLVYFSVFPVFAETVRKFAAAQISGQSHQNDSTSSRTRCSRMDCGFVPSKK